MLNRIDDVVIFKQLDETAIRTIVELELRGLHERLEARQLDLEVSDSAINVLAREGYDPAFGARPVRRAIRQLIEDPLAYELIAGTFQNADGVRVRRPALAVRAGLPDTLGHAHRAPGQAAAAGPDVLLPRAGLQHFRPGQLAE